MRVLGAAQERRQELLHLVRAHAATNVRRPGRLAGLSRSQSVATSSGVADGPELDRDRVVHAREELDVRAVELPRALADPEQVRRAVVPVVRQRVAARQPLLVLEQQALVAREDVHLVQPALGAQVDAARGHELQRAVDVVRQPLVPPPLGRRRDELLVPEVHRVRSA